MDSTTDLSLKRLQQWKCADILFAITRYDGAPQETAAESQELASTLLETSGELDVSGETEQSGETGAQDLAEPPQDAARGSRLFLGSSNFSVFELDTSDEQPERVEFTGDRHTSYVTSLTRCGDRLVSASYDGRLIWWDIASGKAVRGVTAHDRWIRRVVATPSGRQVISVADDMLCKVWDAATGELQFTLSGHAEKTPHHYPSMLYTVCVSGDERWFATADKVGHVAIWDLSEGTKVATLDAPGFYTWDPKQRIHSIGGIRSLAFSPCGEKLALGGIGQIGNIDHLGGPSRIELFHWQNGEHLLTREDEKHKGLVEQMAWHANGKWLLCAGGDNQGFLTIWDLESEDIVEQQGTDGHIHGFTIDADWRSLHAAAHHRIEHWQLTNEGVAGG